MFQPPIVKQFTANNIYLYDLPKSTCTSTSLAKLISDYTGYKLETMPQIRRDPNKIFYSAVIKIENTDKLKEVA